MRIMDGERGLRDKLFKENRAFMEDKVYRARGTLESARIISSDEAASLLSDLRLGAGVINGVDTALTDRLLWEIAPCNVTLRNRAAGENIPRDVKRAEIIRGELGKLCN